MARFDPGLGVSIFAGDCAITVRKTIVARLTEPFWAVTVSENVPKGELPAGVIVSVVVPEPFTVLGEKVPVAPAGSPEAAKLTVPLKVPLFTITV